MARVFSRVLIVLLTILLIVGGVALLPSCGEGEQVTLGKMHIIDATHLFIAPGSGNKLFKITEAGYIQEVTYEDENGNNVTMVEEPVAIYDVDPEYVIVCFGENEVDISEGYLVRKTDGAVFSLENAGFPSRNWGYMNNESVFTDSSSNIYYLSGDREIIKLNMGNTDSITKIRYSPSGDIVYNFFIVDKDGNAAYHGRAKEGGIGDFIRIRTAEGSIYDGLFDDSPYLWLGPDGVIYCAALEHCEGKSECWNPYFLIEKMSVNATTGVPTKSDYFAFNISGEYSIVLWTLSRYYKLELQDRVIFVPADFDPADPWKNWPHIFEVYNPTNSARYLNMTACFGLTGVYSALATDNFYYLHGSNNSSDSFFVKVDPTDDSYAVLALNTDEYYLYTWAPSVADELIFNALRMSDGVMVVGKFDVSGNMTILDEEVDVEIVVLERIQ